MKIVIPKYPKGWGKLKPLPLKQGYCDTDKDLIPNNVDCKPFDASQQGPLSWAISKIKKKPYAEVEQERLALSASRSAKRESWREGRHAKSISRLKRQQEIEQEKKPILAARMGREREKLSLERERLGVQKTRATLQQQKMRAMPKMPSLMGAMGGGSAAPVKMPSLSETFGLSGPVTPAPAIATAKKTRKRRRKSKKGKK